MPLLLYHTCHLFQVFEILNKKQNFKCGIYVCSVFELLSFFQP